MESNAKRYLNCYNTIDHSLRNQYNFKRSMSYSDVIRRCVPLNSVVRKYEDDLVDCGRLRNAIVHNNDENRVIAQPNTDVVEKIELIAKLIATPPKCLDTVCQKDVLCLKHSESLKKTIETISKSGYSNLPVYENENLIGFANGQRILDVLGLEISKGTNIDRFITTNSIGNIVNHQNLQNIYTIANCKITISEALDIFYHNRKLLIILITKNGASNEPALGIVSVSDIIDINNILEDY